MPDGRTLEEQAEAELSNFIRTPLYGLATAHYEPPDYALDRLLPRSYVSLLSGHGGMGKSMLAATWAAHCASGRQWCGLGTAKVRTVLVSLEDPGELVRLRLRNIANAYGLPHRDLEGGITLLDATRGNPILAQESNFNGERILMATAAMNELREEAIGAGLIVIDNASDAYAANENDRRQVRGFMKMLGDIARETGAAVLLLAHVDKAAVRHGGGNSNFSGSTAWHNSARSRLALLDDNGPVLVHEKLNLGRIHDPIRLTFNEHGVLLPVTRAIVADAKDDDKRVVLDALTRAHEAGVVVPTATTGPATAALSLDTFLSAEHRTKDGRRRVHMALMELQADGSIVRESYLNSYRHQRECWQLTQYRANPAPEMCAEKNPIPHAH